MISLVYNNLTEQADFTRLAGKNLDTDAGLQTAVTISLFSNDRAQQADDVDPSQDQGGWWGAQYLDQPGGIGSRLWLITRDKLTENALKKCAQFAEDALQWMIAAGVAAKITATAVLFPGTRVINSALLTVNITRPNKLAPRFSAAWQVQFAL